MKPIIVDSTELFDEILDKAHSRPGIRLIDGAHRHRIRLFAGDHVASEVPAKISQHFPRRGAASEEGLRIWSEDYVPYVRFVDTEGLPSTSTELDLLAARDPSDLGQARLTTLLSPVLSVSSDRDLVDYGFAVKARWTIAHAAQLQLEAEGSYMAVVLPGGLVWAGFDSAFQAAGSAWGKPGKLLVSVATVSGIWLLVRAVRKADPPTRAKLLGVIETVMQMLAEANEKHQRAENQLAQALIYASGMSERLVADIAAALATSTEPLTATQLSRDLWTTEGPVPQTFLIEIQHQLSSLPAFVQVGRYGWDLGRRAAFVQVN